jgi:hypothetical protein
MIIFVLSYYLQGCEFKSLLIVWRVERGLMVVYISRYLPDLCVSFFYVRQDIIPALFATLYVVHRLFVVLGSEKKVKLLERCSPPPLLLGGFPP